MSVIIDRFEGDFAIVELENKKTVSMPKVLLPREVKEGDVIEIRIDATATEERKKNIKKLMIDVWE